MTKQEQVKLYYVNNLRIILIILILMLHIAITYGAEGSWYYDEPNNSLLTAIILTIFNAVVQSFVLGFFFMISGYFVPGSLKRKGAKRYLKDRFARLGIPLLVYYFIISPFIVYFLYVRFMGEKISFPMYFGTGPLWFVQALLIFTIVYVIWQQLVGNNKNSGKIVQAPGNMGLLYFGIGLSFSNFIARIFFPIGKTLSNLQFAFFPGYIGLFIVGLIAYQNNWFNTFSDKVGRRWLKISVLAIILFPVISILAGAIEDITPFEGGFHWQSLLLSTWEAFTGISLIAGMFVIFRKRLNAQGRLAQTLSDNAYSVYVIHAPVIVFFTYAIRDFHIFPLLKFILVSITAVSLCFLISHYLVRKLPYAKKIL